MSVKGKILWVDDEIDLLKPHIIYLEDKGYNVVPVHTGEDAIHLTENNSFDLVLLDEMMTGLDGITTLKYIKENNPNLPVIMITKNEQESLMEEAIASHITNYLTKPVNPSQILMACKNVLETKKILSESVTKGYLQNFQEISEQISSANKIDDWYKIYDSLTEWMIKFDSSGEQAMIQILNEQHIEANNRFSNFIVNNYKKLISKEFNTVTSPKILDTYVKPFLDKGKDVVLIVIDCLRLDQWKYLENVLYEIFNIKTEYHLSILPTATPFSRNSIFSGIYPDELSKKFPDEWKKMICDETSMNRFEDHFLKSYLLNNNLSHISMNYSKIIYPEDGEKISNRINEYKKLNLLAIVVNFVDILGHSRSESNILKELIPDESAYRKSVCSWMQQSWLKNVFEQISSWNKTIILTSDHGSIRVKKPVQIKGDKETSDGIRYKFGKNLHISSKVGMKIDSPNSYKLPIINGATNYIISKNEHFFLYPNNYNHFIQKYENSFQHGGISLDEMIVPVAIMSGKGND